MLGKKVKSWVAIADGAKARIYSNYGPRLRLKLESELDSESARHATHELVSDREGRSFSSASPRRAGMEAPTDPQTVEKQKFIKELADYLDAAAQRGRFEELFLVAAPRTLGELRKRLNGHAGGLVKAELDKDLTNIPEPELAKHLEPLEIGKPPLS
ncbi:MAG: host attachment protein [Alphaproteobacteria bacterium]|nr:host attachment protein [Alphaproteobacteria bacterium]